MKQLLSLFISIMLVFQAVAQPEGPKSGGVYTLTSLSALMPGAIQTTSLHHFRIVQNVTLEPNDTLLLMNMFWLTMV